MLAHLMRVTALSAAVTAFSPPHATINPWLDVASRSSARTARSSARTVRCSEVLGDAVGQANSLRELMCALETIYDTERVLTSAEDTNRERERQLCDRRFEVRSVAAQVRERMERAVLQAEQDQLDVQWPASLPSLGLDGGLAGNNIMALHAAFEPIRLANDGAQHLRREPVFRRTDANDAWLLSVLVYHWRTSKLFQAIREAQDVPPCRLKEAARFLRGLLSERRGGSVADDARREPVRTVRQLILSRGDELSARLLKFDAIFDDSPPALADEEWRA